MHSIVTPLFAGDLHDTALRLAQAQPAHARAKTEELGAAWRQMLELGWQAVLVPEEFDGAGASLADFASIVEAVATRALTVPLIERCAVAPSLLSAAAETEAARQLLAASAAGEASVAPVLHQAPQHRAAARPALGRDGKLHGTQLRVDWSAPATHIVFDARRDEDGTPVLLLLDAAGLDARMRRYVGVDGRITADVDLEGLAVSDAQVLLAGNAVDAAVDAAQQLGSLLECVRTIGACGAIIEQTVDYLHTRMQFGAQLSSFQALRHRLVEMYVAYENARGLVREQVLQHAQAPDARQVALTRLYLQSVGRSIGESTIQLHGGMGMSQETLAARLAMHALMSGLSFGDKSQVFDWLVAGTAAEAQPA